MDITTRSGWVFHDVSSATETWLLGAQLDMERLHNTFYDHETEAKWIVTAYTVVECSAVSPALLVLE